MQNRASNPKQNTLSEASWRDPNNRRLFHNGWLARILLVVETADSSQRFILHADGNYTTIVGQLN